MREYLSSFALGNRVDSVLKLSSAGLVAVQRVLGVVREVSATTRSHTRYERVLLHHRRMRSSSLARLGLQQLSVAPY